MELIGTHQARYLVLSVELAGELAETIGILLEDPARDRLWVRLRRDWDAVAPGEAEVLSGLEADLSAKATEMGASGLLAYLEDTLSNVLRIGGRTQVMVEDFPRALDRFYRQHVRSAVREFVTHLPRYSLEVAAGRFLDNREVTAEGWDEAPADLRLTPEMFVARVVGRSMEPSIPDESLCIFRAGVTGSRQGRLVLVEARGQAGSDRYTVKRYRSEKRRDKDDAWEHGRIRLEALNPEYESWDLDPEEERYRIVGEFVRVLAED